MRSRTWWTGLGVVLAVAAAARFPRLGWGLEEGVYFPDEPGQAAIGGLLVAYGLALGVAQGRHDLDLLTEPERLESGATGVRPVHHLPVPRRLRYRLDVRLDPAFAVDLWQGAIGVRVSACPGVVGP